MSDLTKKCRYCAEEIRLEAILCKHCGMSLVTNTPSRNGQATGVDVTDTSQFQNQTPAMRDPKPGQGLSIASLILGIVAAMFSFSDIGYVTSGQFAYIDPAEIGWLAIMSLTALALAIASAVKKQKLGIAALIISAIAVVAMLGASAYSL